MKLARIPARFLAVLMVCLLTPVVAYAVPYEYSYTGSVFDRFVDANPQNGWYDAQHRAKARLTAGRGRLPDDGDLYDIGPYLAGGTVSDGCQAIGALTADGFDFVATVVGGQMASGDLFACGGDEGWPAVDGRREGAYNEHGGRGRIGGTYAGAGGGEAMPLDLGEVFAVGAGSPTPVPEPSTVLLFSLGLIGIAWYRRKLPK